MKIKSSVRTIFLILCAVLLIFSSFLPSSNIIVHIYAQEPLANEQVLCADGSPPDPTSGLCYEGLPPPQANTDNQSVSNGTLIGELNTTSPEKIQMDTNGDGIVDEIESQNQVGPTGNATPAEIQMDTNGDGVVDANDNPNPPGTGEVATTSPEEIQMDTNGDGVVDASDNPNSPGTDTTTDAGCVPSSTTLSIKANGPDVTNLQNMLIRLGYSVGPQGADGDFGTNTQAAVIKFQQDNKLNPNGVVDSNTWTALCSSPISSFSNPTTNPTPGAPGQPSSAGYTICTRPNNDHKSLMAFINNPNASALDFLPRDKCLEYRNFQWDNNDYLGGTVGPNEKTETIPMIEALKSVNPERRVTVTGDAILCVMCAADDPFIIVTSDGKRTISDTLWDWIVKQEVVVQGSGTTAKMLNKYAADSFKQMKEAARRDGIDLIIGSTDRSKSAADTGCTNANNAWVVACFPNSHNLGLAVDFYLSKGTQKFCEACTGIMQNVVNMRQSPIHKWLFLNAAKYNWYPFTHEPWHWEYNPPGFRSTFFSGAPQ